MYRYCIHDADACRLLWCKRNILAQNMEISKLSFTPLSYAFTKADGVKVRNMVAHFAHKAGFSVPMTSTSCDIRCEDEEKLEEFGKFPGAYVPEPQKGISLTPVSALDFASLYPSIIMAKNLSPESIIKTETELLKAGFTLDDVHPITVPFSKTITLENGEKTLTEDKITGFALKRNKILGVYP